MKRIRNPWLKTSWYNCFCCCPTNPIGLHLQFFEDGDDIVGFWHPDDNYQSWKNTLHGGIQSMLLDEVAGWVVTRKLQTTGVTSKMDVKYIKPLTTTEKAITLRARIAKQMRNVVFIDAELLNDKEEVCTSATLVYFCATKEKAFEQTGFVSCEVEETEE